MQIKEMRRKDKAMTHEDALAFLKTQNEGILALSGSNGYPYAVPLNFAFLDDETIMFHCAPTGQKLDFIGDGCEACTDVALRTVFHLGKYDVFTVPEDQIDLAVRPTVAALKDGHPLPEQVGFRHLLAVQTGFIPFHRCKNSG